MPGRFVTFLKILLSSLVLLVAAQAFNGVLTLSSLEKLYGEILSQGFRIAGHDAAEKVETAMRLGKPLDQFFGFDRLAGGIQEELPEASGIYLVAADGAVVQQAGATPPIDIQALLAPVMAALVEQGQTADGASRFVETVDGTVQRYLAFPLAGRDTPVAGALVLAFPLDLLRSRLAAVVEESTGSFLIATGLAAVLMLLAMREIMRLARAHGKGGWRFLAIPAVILVGAQLFHSVETVRIFRDAYVDAARSSAARMVDQVAEDVEFVLAKGLPLSRLRGLDKRLAPLLSVAPEAARLAVETSDGQTVAEEISALTWSTGLPVRLSGLTPGDSSLEVSQPLHGKPAVDGGAAPVVGRVVVNLDVDAIEARLEERVLDAATVLLVSVFFLVELFVLFGIVVRRSMAAAEGAAAEGSGAGAEEPAADGGQATRHDGHHLLARPVGFTFLWGWALPLSFIPLHMRGLPPLPGGLSESVALALPLSVEAACALVTALVAGKLSDTRGWHVPFLGGLAVSVVGALASGLAPDGVSFIIGRGITGLGYGLAWMGLQGFIYQHAKPTSRAQGISNLVAGLMAGYICGMAIGGMLAERLGTGGVFLVSAIAVGLPLVLGVALLRPWMGKAAIVPAETGARTAASPPLEDRIGLRGLLGNRGFQAVLLGSVIPFSIAQVGLLYYAIPLAMDGLGFDPANIGRVLMIYGLIVIYIGPLVGRRVDGCKDRRRFIFAGGVVGGLGLMSMLIEGGGVWVLVAAVAFLALSSALTESARSSFALGLPATRRYGVTGAMSVQRAADKLGQTLGPLLMGVLFAAISAPAAIAATGALFLAATFLFLVMARGYAQSGS